MPDEAVLDAPVTAPVQDTPAAPAQRESRPHANIPIDDDPFTQFDAKTEAKPKAAAPPKPVTKDPVDKTPLPDKKPEAKTDDKPKEGEAKTAEAPKVDDVPPEKMAPKALREAYAKLKSELQERQAKHAAEVEALKKSTAPKDDPEKAELLAKFTEMEKRAKALDEEMRYLDYEKSSEFKEKHYNPYVQTCQDAVAAVGELKVANADGTTRTATADDLWKIVEINNTEDALTAAEELFGSATKANYVIGLRNNIRQANNAMQKAKLEFRQVGATRAAEMQKQQEARMQRLSGDWKNLNEQAVEKYPQWFKADEGDEKGAELLKTGFELADLAFSGRNDIPEEKMLALHSAIRNQAAGFRYQVHKRELAEARVTELEKKLAEYEKSTPRGGETAKEAGKEESDDPFARFES